MANLNRIQLIGNLGHDFELKHTQGGVACGTVSLAVTESYKGRDGEPAKRTEWFRLSLFGPLPGSIGKYLKKGRLIYADGRVQTREYETEDGEKRRISEVRVRNIQLLSPPPAAGAGGEADETPTPPREITEVPPELSDQAAAEAADATDAIDVEATPDI